MSEPTVYEPFMREAMTLADTFAVMYRGRFIDVFPRTDEARVESIGLMMAGIRFGEDEKEAVHEA